METEEGKQASGLKTQAVGNERATCVTRELPCSKLLHSCVDISLSSSTGHPFENGRSTRAELSKENKLVTLNWHTMPKRISVFDSYGQEPACEEMSPSENQFQYAGHDQQTNQKNDADYPEKNLHVYPLKKWIDRENTSTARYSRHRQSCMALNEKTLLKGAKFLARHC